MKAQNSVLKTVVCLSIFVLLSTPAAQAQQGGSGPGGGVAFVCDEGGKQAVYLADTYQLIKSGAIRDTTLWPDAVVVSASEILNKSEPEISYPHPFIPAQKVSLGWMLIHRWNELQTNAVIVDQPLPLLPDAHIDPKTIPSNCQATQIVIQDIREGRMRWRFDLVIKMSHLERGLLGVHEALISLRNEPGADTTPIRAKVARISDHFDFAKIAQEVVVPMPNAYQPTAEEFEASQTNNTSICQEIYNDARMKGDADVAQNYAPADVSRCQLAQIVLKKEQAKEAAARNFVTIMKVPENLQCQITGTVQDDFNSKPDTLNIKQLDGQNYQFRFEKSGRVSTRETTQSWFNIAPDMPESEVSHLSRFTFEAVSARHDYLTNLFDPPADTVSLFIENYVEQTGLFYGYVMQEVKGEKITRSSHFGLACWSPKIDFDNVQ